MFAGGSGIAPFAGFLQEQMQNPEARNWLYFGIRTEMELHHRALLEKLVGAGQMQLRVAFSREEKQMVVQAGRLTIQPGLHCHVDDLIEEDAQSLWKIIQTRTDGGEEAHFYICGRTGFAESIMSGLRKVIRHFVDSDESASAIFHQLMADRRLMLDIFTTYRGATSQAKQVFDISEVVLHNNESHGYWMVLDGKVYDLTEFIHLHAGGKRILANNAGIDATRAYQSVQHHLNTEVDAFLGMYEMGRMRRLNFGMNWGVGLGPQGMFFCTLEEAFIAWVRYLYLVTEMENALANDYSFLKQLTTQGENPGELTPLKVHLLAEAHKRFIATFLDGILSEDLHMLWSITTGLCDHQSDNRWMQRSIQEASSSELAQLARNNHLQSWLDLWRSQNEAVSTKSWEKAIDKLCLLISAENQRCFNDLKLAIRAGVGTFERYGAQVTERGRAELLAAIRQIPKILQAYYERLANGIQMLASEPNLPLQLVNVPEDAVAQFTGHGAQLSPDELTKADSESQE